MAQLSLSLVEKKGGSVGPAINSCMPLNITANSWLTDEGSEWLRSGVVIDSTVGYPNASFFADHYIDHGVTYDISPVITGADIAWDGSNWWHYDDTNKQIVQYTEAWVLTGVTINTAATMTTQGIGMCTNGTSLFIGNYSNRRVYEYSISGLSYVGYVSTTGYDTLYGLCWDGDNFWTAGPHSVLPGNHIIQYDASWVPTGLSWYDDHVDAGSSVRGFSYNPLSNNLYMASSAKKVIEWTKQGVYVQTYEFTTMPPGAVYGLEWKDDVLYGLNSSDDILYTAVPVNYIGLQTAYIDENGVGIFTRIK